MTKTLMPRLHCIPFQSLLIHFSLAMACLSFLSVATAEDTLSTVTILDDAPSTEIKQSRPEESASHVTVIRRQEFQDGAMTLSDVLANQTGIKIRQVGGLGTYSEVSLRGASAKQVMIYLDGMPLNSANGQTVDLSQINLDQIEQVEIYRDNAPIQFSEQAQGGVISLTTRKAANASTSTQLSATVGDFGTRKLGLSNSGRHQNWHHYLSLNHQSAENDFPFESDNGTPFNPYDDSEQNRNNNATLMQNALFKLGYQFNSRQSLSGQIAYLNSQQEIPTLSNDPKHQDRFDKQTLQAQVNFQHHGQLKTDWSHQTSFLINQSQDTYQPKFDQTQGKSSDYDTNSQILQNYSERFVQIGSLDTIAKFNVALKNEQFDTQVPDNPMFPKTNVNNQYNRKQLNLGGEWLMHFPDEMGAFIPDIRFQHLKDELKEQETGDSTLSENDVTGNLGLVFQPTGSENLQLKSNLGNNVRQPSFSEKYSNQGLVKGNPDLKKETGIHRDISLLISLPQPTTWLNRVHFSVSGFYNDSNDVIVQTYNAQGVGRAVNLANANIWGSELESGLETPYGQSLQFNMTYQQSEVKSSDVALNQTRLPNQPEWMANVLLSQQWQGWKLTYQFHFEQGAYYDHTNLLPVPTQRIHDLSLAYQFKSVRIRLDAKNLQDQQLEIFNGFPSPGRSFYLTLDTHF